jgi:hypothetical protein
MQDAREIVYIADEIVVFRAGAGDADRVAFLKGVVADQMRGDLPRDADDRNGVHQGVGQAGVTGAIALPEGVEMVMPGDNVNMKVTLIMPVALEQGSKFAIREGGLTVGAGVITKILS